MTSSQSSSITSSTSSTESTASADPAATPVGPDTDRLGSIDESPPAQTQTQTSVSSAPDHPSIIPLPNDELDLLIKLERANKEMETNHRSAQSILQSSVNGSSTNVLNTNNSSPPSHSLSRRASFTSCEVNSLNNDDVKNMDEVSWELWNQIIADWTTWSKKKPTQLKEYIRKGIPIYLRPLAWQYLCGAHLTDAREKYKEYLKKSSACEKIIRRDVDRTYPDTDFFRSSAGQESLFNVMKAYSIHDPEVGYCQGSAFICGLLLIQNVPEEEAFAIFVQIMQQYNLREIYKPNMYHLGLCMFQLDSLLQEFLPDLHRHFITHAFHPSMYCSSWFLTLFTTSLPLPLVCRIFDIFLNEGFEIIFRVGLALLDFHKDSLLGLDMEGMLKYFQKELPPKHESDHDGILNKAFAIKYNPRKMKKLEKDFSILKKEEQEEQVEMRRLRAENKLLKQRIDNLEKESAQLAERLIKGQVVNAQNAESIYVLKNENQKLKDKINELQLECEHSNELRRKQMTEQSLSSHERNALNERVTMLLEENNKLRDNPENSRLEEELLLVKMREAEAQLAIKELQKTIHVLNLEYQEFLNNRQAFILAGPSGNGSASGGVNGEGQPKQAPSSQQQLEEELLKIKLREAEVVSEMKSLNLRLMQLDTEKQVAYNQIKRQDEEIRKLNQQITEILERELDQKSQLVELRRQLDDKDAQLKEMNMTHKLQEAEDAHVIAELRQRVASLEVQIQELETTGQLNNDTAMYNNLLATSTDNLVMPSSSQLDRRSSFKMISRQMRNSTTVPVNGHAGGVSGPTVGMNNSISLSSIPATLKPQLINLSGGDLTEKPVINRSCSIDSGGSKLMKQFSSNSAMSPSPSPPQNGNQVIAEYLDSESEENLNGKSSHRSLKISDLKLNEDNNPGQVESKKDIENLTND